MNGKHENNLVISRGKWALMLVSLLLVAALSVGGTLAYLFTNTQEVKNTFTPASMGTEVDEQFDGSVKKNVTIFNTSDAKAFVRIILVSYMTDDSGNITGEAAPALNFTMGTGWVKSSDGIYYYTTALAPGAEPKAPLVGESGIQLAKNQVIEVIAEVIQAEPETAAETAWGVTITGDSLSVN